MESLENRGQVVPSQLLGGYAPVTVAGFAMGGVGTTQLVGGLV
jgi:hypothetical protein